VDSELGLFSDRKVCVVAVLDDPSIEPDR
jgi:hypothetical protein